MVIMEAIKRLYSRDAYFRCSFYRTSSGVEVDFICETQDKLFAYEIKFTKTLSKEMIKSLSLFKKDFPQSEMKLISLNEGETELTREVRAIHWSSIL